MVVSNHYGHGFVAHPYRYGGVEYVHRTYYYNGAVYSRIYRPYVWGGVPINVYMPAYYYPRAYYGWAYNPWGAPVVYTAWGWGGSPWYGYYGGWFTPYPTYAGPAFWLTDYIMAQTLMAAYQERAADAAAMSFTEPMPPYVKNLVAEEVRRQIALENSEAAGGAQAQPDPGSSGIARMLSDGQSHVFVVANSLDVNSTSGECFVTEGDVLQLQGSVAAGAASANLSVLASKGKDCAKGSVVQVQIADLQDMQNHMRETVDQGLNELKNKQGQNGIPPVPDSAKGEGQKTAFAAIAPPPDPNVKTELSETSKEAVEAEAEVLHEASGPSADTTDPPPPPPQSGAKKSVESGQTGKKSVELGQTIDEVVSILGPPKNIVDLGSTKIYLYDLMKFTFKDGKLTKSE